MFSSGFSRPPGTQAPALAQSMFAPGGIQYNQNQNQNPSSQSQSSAFNTNLNPSTTNVFGPQQLTADSGTKIDIHHLRPTTKYDQLTRDLQAEIEAADSEIAAQIKHAEELEVLIPNVKGLGEGLKPQVELVDGKLNEVQEGFERDAFEIVEIREGIVKRDEGEAKLCLREVERLKAPSQYQMRGMQVGGNPTTQPGTSGGVYGGMGLSGWWNNPQTLRGGMHGGGLGGKGIQIPIDDDADADETKDPRVKAPASLVELFSRRADDMHAGLVGNAATLAQIEAYIGGLEDKIRGRERELVDRMDYGALAPAGGDSGAGEGGVESERAEQLRMLKFVFGEAERSLYEVAGKIGEVRDQVVVLTREEAGL